MKEAENFLIKHQCLKQYFCQIKGVNSLFVVIMIRRAICFASIKIKKKNKLSDGFLSIMS